MAECSAIGLDRSREMKIVRRSYRGMSSLSELCRAAVEGIHRFATGSTGEGGDQGIGQVAAGLLELP